MKAEHLRNYCCLVEVCYQKKYSALVSEGESALEFAL